jgi:hypothetical protein
MELSSSAFTGAMKVGVQIVSAHKQPLLEIYQQARSISTPGNEYQSPTDSYSGQTRTIKDRRHEVFIEFILVNIGGSRAQNIKLTLTGELRRNPPRESFDGLFDVIIPQMPPGQSSYLFKFDMSDLNYYENDVGSPIRYKTESFTITMEYDSGKGILNWLLSLFTKIRGKRRFRDEYTFSPNLVSGDLPPIEYV